MFVPQDFVVSFFVELSVMMLERLYLDPGAKEVRDVDFVVFNLDFVLCHCKNVVKFLFLLSSHPAKLSGISR